jgi:hypothetical protein
MVGLMDHLSPFSVGFAIGVISYRVFLRPYITKLIDRLTERWF